ncbi:MAG: acetolactate synthase small subunit [Verrucomicrobiota bacterium]|jgi:acetolactate synthase-1/3 small subunit
MSRSHVLSLTVVNKAGVLSRLIQVFARRGFNIDSLIVSPEMDGRFSRITITAQGSSEGIEQIVHQIGKLVDVLHCTEHADRKSIVKEFAMVKVRLNPANRTEILQFVDHFKARTVDLSTDSLVIEATGKTEKIDSLIEMLRPHGIIELVRSGKMLMARGSGNT